MVTSGIFLIICLHLSFEKCIEKCQKVNTNEIELESNVSNELQITNLTGPEMLIPILIVIGLVGGATIGFALGSLISLVCSISQQYTYTGKMIR